MNRIYIYGILLLLSEACFGQSFSTRISAATIGKQDVIQVEYIAENADLQQFTLPTFTNWTVVSGPNLSSSTVQTGNTVKQEVIYSVMVQPNSTGVLIVPGATALVNDKPQKSNSLKVTVKNVAHLSNLSATRQKQPAFLFDEPASQDPIAPDQYLKKGEKAIDKIKNNILVKLEVDKKVCYLGEPVIVTYKLCTRLKSKSKVVKQPQFSGCTVVELTADDQNQHVETVNGTDYNVFVIRKVQLYPLNAGKLTLPFTSVENRVSFYNNDNLSWRDLYYNVQPGEEHVVTLQNKQETITVNPLPVLPDSMKTGFSGAVGDFDITVAIKDQPVKAGETNHLQVFLQGEGNLKDADLPAINWPQGIEAFDAEEYDETNKNILPVTSKKIISIPFIPGRKGRLAIPPVAFTYFNPKTKHYVTAQTGVYTITVEGDDKKNIISALQPVNNTDFNGRLTLLLGVAGFAVLLGLFLYNRKLSDRPAIQTNSKQVPDVPDPLLTQISPSEYLFKIRELQPENNNSGFYKELCKHLDDYLKARYGTGTHQLEALRLQHPDKYRAFQKIRSLAETCNLGAYTPAFTVEEAMQHRLQAIEALTYLEQEEVT